jgi:octaprenyl-diphosphate synthase
MAFQIADDLLDLLGEERNTGKSLGTDVEQQKLTLPLIWLMRHGSPDTVQTLERTLSGSGDQKVEQLRAILEESDALNYTRLQADQFAAAARRELEELSDSPAKQVLVQLTHFVVQRSA